MTTRTRSLTLVGLAIALVAIASVYNFGVWIWFMQVAAAEHGWTIVLTIQILGALLAILAFLIADKAER
jgi:hypothetical protein